MPGEPPPGSARPSGRARVRSGDGPRPALTGIRRAPQPLVLLEPVALRQLAQGVLPAADEDRFG
ncbi:hypothetical protein AB0R11_29090, partial [Streptomyces fradiae]|uniref:hypothetical protein n=1 Tax=Streptomyces fradiae TaxID=1906 RepID=UPI003417804D